MSAELIEIDENCDGQDISLEMKAGNDAWLGIRSRSGMEQYHLTPNSDGIEQAEAIIMGLQEWIDHVKGNFPPDLLGR
jgi:hypothetical protein